jgi:hypothetical protein
MSHTPQQELTRARQPATGEGLGPGSSLSPVWGLRLVIWGGGGDPSQHDRCCVSERTSPSVAVQDGTEFEPENVAMSHGNGRSCVK